VFAQWGGTRWGVVGFAKGSLGGLCCEHCEVDGYGGDGGFGVSVVRMRKSVTSVLGLGSFRGSFRAMMYVGMLY
jgi:hypothetical protein